MHRRPALFALVRFDRRIPLLGPYRPCHRVAHAPPTKTHVNPAATAIIIPAIDPTTEGHARHDEGARAEERAGVEHGIAADFGFVAKNRAEFAEAGADDAGGVSSR